MDSPLLQKLKRNNSKLIKLHELSTLKKKYSKSSYLKKILYTNTWTLDDVSCWLYDLNLSLYIQIFNEHSIDGKALLLLTRDDLIEIGITIVGDYKIILREINQILCN